jgi:hypothetical protein
MTTAFQYVFDNAESISIDTKRIVGSTLTRDQTLRTTSRGGQTWRFDVKLPDGIRWSDARQYIAKLQALDRTTVGTVQINNAGYNSYLTPYQGNAANSAAITASWTQGGSTITLTGGQAASGYNFRAGDYIQLKTTGRVYSVTADVAYNSNTVTLHRPIIDATSSGTLVVGSLVTWSVLCYEFPNWTIFARNQVSWSGSFIFYENMI